MINLTILKFASVEYAIVGDIIDYKVIVRNEESIDLENVSIYDMLSPKLEFIKGSVKIDNKRFEDENIVSGIDLGTIKVVEERVITFKAKALDSGLATNKVIGKFHYQCSECDPIQCGTSTSCENMIEIANVLISAKKKADKDFAVLGETIEYTIKIINEGKIPVKNLVVKDEISKNLSVEEDSITINGVTVNNLNLKKGVNIRELGIGEKIFIKYVATVKSVPCDGKIKNSVVVNYCYNLTDEIVGESKVESDDTSSINVGINNFKQISIEEKLIIPIKKPDVEEVLSIDGDIEILKSHIIQTSSAVSNEGQNLTGYKLVVYGRINEVVEYKALDVEQSVHSAHYSIPFTTFIVLPANYKVGMALNISGDIEDIYFNRLDCREIFSNATVLIKAILCRN